MTPQLQNAIAQIDLHTGHNPDTTTMVEWEVAVRKRSKLNKKDVLKLKPGAIIRIAWYDSSDGSDLLHLLLEKPENEPGEVNLFTIPICPKTGKLLSAQDYAVHWQVIEQVGTFSFVPTE